MRSNRLNYAAKLAATIAEAAKTGPNMNEAEGGGGDFDVSAIGLARARLVGYFEKGKHEEENIHKMKVLREKVDLVFELSGPNHPMRKNNDGSLTPQRITVRETLDLTEAASFFKLFGQMNYAGKATHMAQLLGEAFIVEVFHRKSKDGKQTFANLKGLNGYNVREPSIMNNIITGETEPIPVEPPLTELRAFIWDVADKEMWDSIYIDGEFEARTDKDGNVITPAKSKNVLQNAIKAAANWTELAARLGL